MLPVGIDVTRLTTKGLRWNLSRLLVMRDIYDVKFVLADTESCFDGMVSTSNHLLPEEPTVYIKTSKPIVWTVELKVENM